MATVRLMGEECEFHSHYRSGRIYRCLSGGYVGTWAHGKDLDVFWFRYLNAVKEGIKNLEAGRSVFA